MGKHTNRITFARKERARMSTSTFYSVKVDGVVVGEVADVQRGCGWWVNNPAHGVPFFNSWGNDLKYATVADAREACRAHLRGVLRGA